MSSPAPATRANVAALIPAYLEGRHVRAVVAQVRGQLDQVLVVDDGSTDNTSAEALAGGAEVISHEVNQGKGAAIKTGLRVLAARPSVAYALLLDGDGQHDPAEIPDFLEEMNRDQAPFLVGNRMSASHQMPWVRKATNRSMSWQIGRLCRQSIPDTQCGFRMIRADLFAPLAAAAANNYDYETEMLVIVARLGHAIGSVPVRTIYGEEKSKIRPVRDTVRFIRLLRRLRRPR